MKTTLFANLTVGMIMLGTCIQAQAAEKYQQVVVIVSGGGAVSPFTTPTSACGTGWAAGSTDTFLRNYLIKAGHKVFTSPAMIGGGRVPGTGDDVIGPFGDCPGSLPPSMTVNSAGAIQAGGKNLANFVEHLVTTYKVGKIDFVAHSMGGLFSRAAIKQLRQSNPLLHIGSLTTLATPWSGVPFGNKENCEIMDDQFCYFLNNTFGPLSSDIMKETTYDAMDKLNKANSGVLKGIPVTLIGANAFDKPEQKNPRFWPNDGLVSVSSQLAQDVTGDVINQRRCYMYPGGTHSIWVSARTAPRMDENTAITWNDKVAGWVHDAIRNPAASPKREGEVPCR